MIFTARRPLAIPWPEPQNDMIRFLLTFPIGRMALASFALLYVESASAAGIRDGLVGYWPFDERAGQVAADASGFGQPGALINFTNDNRHWVAGKIAGALEFRGTNSRECVRIPDFIKPTNTMSFSAWVYADSFPQRSEERRVGKECRSRVWP